MEVQKLRIAKVKDNALGDEDPFLVQFGLESWAVMNMKMASCCGVTVASFSLQIWKWHLNQDAM